MLLNEGVIGLLHSTFVNNGDADPVGIVNVGGEIRCKKTDDCFSICTVCLTTPPTFQPTVEQVIILSPPTQQPTIARTTSKQRRRSWSQSTVDWAIVVGLMSVLGLVVMWRCCCLRSNSVINELVAESSIDQRFLPLNDASESSESVELIAHSLVTPCRQLELDGAPEPGESIEIGASFLKSYETSPAPVFVVARDSMRITLWSPGMAIAAPMVVNPVGCLISELPFVNKNDGDRLHRSLVRIFDNLGGHDEPRMFVLHLIVQNRRVLLEMVATHVFVTESEPIIVLTGRQVDAELAGLMVSESVAFSVNEEAVVPCDATDCTNGVHADHEAVVRSIDGMHEISSVSASSNASDSVVFSDRSRMSVRPPAARRLMTTHSWDSENSSARALSCVRPTDVELHARPALNSFLDNVRATQKRRRRIVRQSFAYRNVLSKLCVLGRFLRIARECASLRVLFVEIPVVVPHLATSADVRRCIAEFTWIGAWRAAAVLS